MPVEENKATVRRLIEEFWNGRDLSLADRMLTDGFVNHASPAGLPPGREGFQQFAAMTFAVFPDFRIEIEDMIGEGEKVAFRYTWRGTQAGQLLGIPPTGKPVTVRGIVIFRFADGKMAERWETADDLGMLQQLGVIPAAGQPA